MEYLSLKQTAEKWGITVRRVQVLCSQDRIPGATKLDPSGLFRKKLRSRRIRELRVVNILNLQKNKQYYRGKQDRWQRQKSKLATI